MLMHLLRRVAEGLQQAYDRGQQILVRSGTSGVKIQAASSADGDLLRVENDVGNPGLVVRMSGGDAVVDLWTTFIAGGALYMQNNPLVAGSSQATDWLLRRDATEGSLKFEAGSGNTRMKLLDPGTPAAGDTPMFLVEWDGTAWVLRQVRWKDGGSVGAGDKVLLLT